MNGHRAGKGPQAGTAMATVSTAKKCSEEVMEMVLRNLALRIKAAGTCRDHATGSSVVGSASSYKLYS